MDKIRQIDDKILQLRQRKEEAEIKLARALLKKVQGVLGEDTDVNLASLILEETWNNSSEESKEVWRNKADTFRSGGVTGQTESRKAGETNFTELEESKFVEVGDTKLTEVTKAL